MDAPLSDAKYQARDDAFTLARAEEIKQDSGRMTAAQAAAKKLAEEEQNRIKNLNKVAGKRSKQSSPGEIDSSPRSNVMDLI